MRGPPIFVGDLLLLFLNDRAGEVVVKVIFQMMLLYTCTWSADWWLCVRYNESEYVFYVPNRRKPPAGRHPPCLLLNTHPPHLRAPQIFVGGFLLLYLGDRASAFVVSFSMICVLR